MKINPKNLSFTEQDFDEICKYLKDILFDRKKEYNVQSVIHDYFPHNKTSYESMIYIKWLRAVNNKDISNLDSILDLLNYAFFYADWMRKSTEHFPHRNNIPLSEPNISEPTISEPTISGEPSHEQKSDQP